MINKQIKILDIKINIISRQEVLDKIKNLFFKPSLGEQLVTTNPEFILEAQKNNEFKNIINNSCLSVADGYGIRLASKYVSVISNQQSVISKFLFGIRVAWWGITRNNKKLDIIKEIITGVDLVQEICKFSSVIPQYCGIRLKIFLLGGYGNTSRLAAENLKKQNPKLEINYSIFEAFEADDIINIINNFKPDILFVALNHPRAQIWINNNINKMPSVKLAIGIGGALDYISGKIKRAPQNWQSSYEWLFRLFKQPKRFRRIFNACLKFPWIVFINSTKLNK